jgi:hypothetical protein
MRKITLPLLLTLSSLLYAQQKNLTCLDFTKGEFRNVSEDSNLSSIIVRNGQKQLEITDGVKNYKRLEWLNDCDYVLFFSNKEAKKDKFKKFINKNGGITVRTEKTEGNTLYYKTHYFDGKRTVSSEGKMIKMSNKSSF